MVYVIIGIVTVLALIVVAWFQVRADQERAKHGDAKKHNEQMFTVITFDHTKK